MQRFVQGAGSFVNISLTIKANPKINYTRNYAAFATYDQGSIIGGFSLKSPQYMTYIIFFIIDIAASIAAIFYLRRLIYERRLRYLYKMTSFVYLLEIAKEKADYYYSDGKLRKADYDILVKRIEKRKKFETKIQYYTSEGKPITDEK